MIKSMTGFGKEVVAFPTKTIVIEIRSVNSKNFDFYTRMPPGFAKKTPKSVGLFNWFYREVKLSSTSTKMPLKAKARLP